MFPKIVTFAEAVTKEAAMDLASQGREDSRQPDEVTTYVSQATGVRLQCRSPLLPEVPEASTSHVHCHQR